MIITLTNTIQNHTDYSLKKIITKQTIEINYFNEFMKEVFLSHSKFILVMLFISIFSSFV